MRDARCGSVDSKPNFIYVQSSIQFPRGPPSKYWEVAPKPRLCACASLSIHAMCSIPCWFVLPSQLQHQPLLADSPLGVVLCTCNAAPNSWSCMYSTSIVPVLARLQDGYRFSTRCTKSAPSCEHVPSSFPIRHLHSLYKPCTRRVQIPPLPTASHPPTRSIMYI